MQPSHGDKPRKEGEDMVIGPSGGYIPTKAFVITSKQRNPYKPNLLRARKEEQEAELGVCGTRRSKSRDRERATRSPSTNNAGTNTSNTNNNTIHTRTCSRDGTAVKKLKVI